MLNQMFGNRNLSNHQALISSYHLNLRIDQSRSWKSDFIKILRSSSVLKLNLADSKLLKNYYQPTPSTKHLLLSTMAPVVNIFPIY